MQEKLLLNQWLNNKKTIRILYRIGLCEPTHYLFNLTKSFKLKDIVYSKILEMVYRVKHNLV